MVRSPLEPDVLPPVQFDAASRRAGGAERGRLLMLTVLEDAVDCYRKNAFSCDPRRRKTFTEAREWFMSPDRSRLFSFERICECLEIHADNIRRGLCQWRERTMWGALPESAAESTGPRIALGPNPRARARGVEVQRG